MNNFYTKTFYSIDTCVSQSTTEFIIITYILFKYLQFTHLIKFINAQGTKHANHHEFLRDIRNPLFY